jgi:excisionase family DNA binding protein
MEFEILTISEAARELHIAVQTARDWSDAGKLPAVRTAGGMRLFRREDVDRVKADRTAAIEVRSAAR